MDLQGTYTGNRATFIYVQIASTATLGFAAMFMLLFLVTKDYVGGGVGVGLFVLLAAATGFAVGVSTLELDVSGVLRGPGTLAACPPCAEGKVVVTQRTAECPACPPQPPLVCVLQKLNAAEPATQAPVTLVAPAAPAK